MSHVTGKRVLITGASRGIGEATARLFAALGARVALAARSTPDIRRIAGELGSSAIAIPMDVADPSSVAEGVAQTVRDLGGIDILINNAGIIDPIGMIRDIDPDDWARVIDVNVKGVFNCVHAVLPHMKDGGTILTIGSGAATSALEGWSHYCASKAAVHHLNRCIHAELAGQGIRALVLSPGTVATDMQQVIRKSGINPVAQMNWDDHIPPEWPAQALAWMCGDDADDYLGGVVSLREESVRRRVGLVS